MSKFFVLMIRSWLITLPLLLALIITLFIAIFARILPPRLPLFYSLPWGDSQLVNIQQLLILPASIALITLFNLIISWQLHATQNLFKKILQFCSLLVSLILTITFLKIVLIFI